MAMESWEFKDVVVDFEGNLQRVDEDLYAAIKGRLAPDEIPAAIAAGKQKLQDFKSIIGRLDELKKSQFIETVGEQTDDIREQLKQLEDSNA